MLAGGVHRADVGPYFYAPTVLDDVPAEARGAREETFGPVVTITRVDSDDDAVAVMNDTEYGLNAAVWSRDVARARRVAARIETGSVAINDGYTITWGSVAAPIGGWKASGLGARHGAASIDRAHAPADRRHVARRADRCHARQPLRPGRGHPEPRAHHCAGGDAQAAHVVRSARRPDWSSTE